MPSFADVLELMGAISIVAGCWVLAPWLALIVGGLLAVVAAQAIERVDE